MTLQQGATHEITSRWPEHKQRNVALNPVTYGEQYAKNMLVGIEVVCGRNTNGWTAWTNDKGVTIDSIFRKSKD